MTIETTRNPPGDHLTYGAVHLDVTRRDAALTFWRDVVGLRLLREDRDALTLGTEREALIVLHPGASASVRGRHSGLDHVAIHLPDEPAFARVLARLIAYRWPISPTDHTLSKAIYLNDPDGIGLELTLETPERGWHRGLEFFDAEGRPRNPREPLDIEEVLETMEDDNLAVPLPVGANVGHLHLHVGDLQRALGFYRDAVGFTEESVIPDFGYAELSAGGRFPHRLAMNTWAGAGVTPAPRGTAGLRRYSLRMSSADRLRDALDLLDVVGEAEGDVIVRDPDGNTLHVGARPPHPPRPSLPASARSRARGGR
jgi:catechol 2,3-dioxygenase